MLDEAEKILEEIGRDKPNLREYDVYRKVRQIGGGYTSSNERHEVYNKWKPYYIAEWKLRQAREKK